MLKQNIIYFYSLTFTNAREVAENTGHYKIDSKNK